MIDLGLLFSTMFSRLRQTTKGDLFPERHVLISWQKLLQFYLALLLTFFFYMRSETNRKNHLLREKCGEGKGRKEA